MGKYREQKQSYVAILALKQDFQAAGEGQIPTRRKKPRPVLV
jgi:hypothetical protein